MHDNAGHPRRRVAVAVIAFSLVAASAFARETTPAQCAKGDLVRIVRCLDRKAPKGGSGSPERRLASAMARYAAYLADNEAKEAQKALRDAVAANAEIADAARRGRNAVELQSSIAVQSAAEAALPADAAVAEEAKRSAAHLTRNAAADEEALLALIYTAVTANDGPRPVTIAELASRFVPARDAFRRDLRAASNSDDFTRLSRRGSLLLLAERAFLHLYVTQHVLVLQERPDALRADEPLLAMFGRVSDFARAYVIGVNDTVAEQIKETGALGQVVAVYEMTLALLQSLPEGAMTLRDEALAETAFQLAEIHIALGQTEDARKRIDETAPAVARVPAWSPHRASYDARLASFRQRVAMPFTGHLGGIQTIAIAPAGDVVVTAGRDGTTRFWTPAGAVHAPPEAGHTGVVFASAADPARGQFATGAADQTIRLWNRDGTAAGEPLKSGNEVFGVAFSPRGELLAAALAEGGVEIHTLDGSTAVKTLTGHTGNVYGIAFAPTGDLFASSGQDGAIRLWTRDGTAAGEPIATHQETAFTVAFSPKGDLIASGGNDGSIRLWNRAGAAQGAPLWGHAGAVLWVAFSPAGDLLASSGMDGTVRLWSVAERRQLDAVRGHRANVWCVAFSPAGDRLYSAAQDGAVRRWNVRDGNAVRLREADARAASDPAKTAAYALDEPRKNLLELLRRFEAAALAPRSAPWTPFDATILALAQYHLAAADGDTAAMRNARGAASRAAVHLEAGFEAASLSLEITLIDTLLGGNEGNLNADLQKLAVPLLDASREERLKQVTSRWLLMFLSDIVAENEGGKAPVRAGEFATGFTRLGNELRQRLPLPATASFDTLRDVAWKASTFLLGEDLFLSRHNVIVSPASALAVEPYETRQALYTAMFRAMTPRARETSADTVLTVADYSLLDPSLFSYSAETYRMLRELMEEKPTPFASAALVQAHAVVQLGYLDIAAGQILSSAMLTARAENILENVPESKEKTAALALLKRTVRQRQLIAGGHREAAVNLAEAVSLFDRAGNPNLLTMALLSQAQALDEDFEAAIATAEEGLARLTRLQQDDANHNAAILHMALAQAYWRSDRYDEMKDSLEDALRYADAPVMNAQAKFMMSAYHLDVGRGCEDALPLLEEIAAAEGFLRSDFEESVRISLAFCYSRSGDVDKARPHIDRAVELDRSVRRGKWATEYYRSSYVSPQLPQLESLMRTTLYDLMNCAGTDRAEVARQLLYDSEILRSRQLVDEMQTSRGGIYFVSAADSAVKMKEVEEEAATIGLGGVLPLEVVGGSEPKNAAVEAAEKLRDVVAKLSQRHGRPAVILEYVPIPERDRLLLYVIQETSMDVVDVAVPWSQIVADTERLRRYISLTLQKYAELRSLPREDAWLVERIARLEEETDRVAAALGAALLPAMPGGESLAALLRGKSVVVVPRGVLHALPFAAIRAGSEYLFDVAGRLSIAPSALGLQGVLTHYKSNLENKVGDLLLVGDRADPTLPFVARELDALAALAKESKVVFDRKGLYEHFGAASAVHFATHAYHDPVNPATSGLLLGNDVLTLHDITEQMKTWRTRLVTLGACESSLARATEIGDDVWSLATGFLYTGSPAIVASLWLQDGASSLIFYRAFYGSVMNGDEFGVALQRGVREVRAQKRDGNGRGKLKDLESPAFWAGFTMVGE